MKQRVCIALGIILTPDLIIADEPTSALDVVTQRQVMQTLKDIQEQIGSGLILIGHDMGLMAQSVDELAVLKDGELVEHGTVKQIIEAPKHPYTQDLISSVPLVGGESFLNPDKKRRRAQSATSERRLLKFDRRVQSLWRGHRAASDVLHASGRHATDHLDCRAIRVGQIDDGVDHAGLQPADDRHGAVRRAGPAAHVGGAGAGLPQECAGGFSGPICLLQPVLSGEPRVEIPVQTVRTVPRRGPYAKGDGRGLRCRWA